MTYDEKLELIENLSNHYFKKTKAAINEGDSRQANDLWERATGLETAFLILKFDAYAEIVKEDLEEQEIIERSKR